MVLRMKNKEWIIPIVIGIAIAALFTIRGGTGGVIILFCLVAYLFPVWFILKYHKILEDLIKTPWEKTLTVIIICCIILLPITYLLHIRTNGLDREYENNLCKEAGYDGIWKSIPYNESYNIIHCCAEGQCTLNYRTIIREHRR